MFSTPRTTNKSLITQHETPAKQLCSIIALSISTLEKCKFVLKKVQMSDKYQNISY